MKTMNKYCNPANSSCPVPLQFPFNWANPHCGCLLVNCYLAMCRLAFPWSPRRTTKAERDDYAFVHDALKLNLGRGYYSYDGFAWGPEYRSDACGSREFSGGGYVGQDGFYDYYVFGTSCY